jgi:hypothetical protein
MKLLDLLSPPAGCAGSVAAIVPCGRRFSGVPTK